VAASPGGEVRRVSAIAAHRGRQSGEGRVWATKIRSSLRRNTPSAR
jgi:hypothetical protein